MPTDRRTLLGAGLALSALAGAAAVREADAATPSPTPTLAELMGGPGALRLWPGAPPGGGGANLSPQASLHGDAAHPDRWLTGVATPMLLVSRPARPNGASVMLVPGGGYGFLAFDNEGLSQAAWLNALGVTTFILLYRLPGEGWGAGAAAPLQDAQRGMRVIRREAPRLGLDPGRVGVIGFSAGGHLAGSLATRAGEPLHPPVDAADGLSARPDLAGLIYPVITLTSPYTHPGSRDALLGAGAHDPALQRRWSVESHVGSDTPPCFVVHAGDDGLVPVENSLLFYSALHAAGRPAELHVFAAGGHGFGVRLPPNAPAMQWPGLFTTFARSQGLFA